MSFCLIELTVSSEHIVRKRLPSLDADLIHRLSIGLPLIIPRTFSVENRQVTQNSMDATCAGSLCLWELVDLLDELHRKTVNDFSSLFLWCESRSYHPSIDCSLVSFKVIQTFELRRRPKVSVSLWRCIRRLVLFVCLSFFVCLLTGVRDHARFLRRLFFDVRFHARFPRDDLLDLVFLVFPTST